MEIAGKDSSLDLIGSSYKIVAFDWDGTAVRDRSADAAQITRKLERLMGDGCTVVVITGTHKGNVERQFCDRIECSQLKQNLYLCVNRGSQVFTYDSRGDVKCIYERRATDRENTIMDGIAVSVRNWLHSSYGYESDIVFDRMNRRKIDLIPLDEWREPRKERIGELLDAVNSRLEAVGLQDGICKVIDKVKELANERGLRVRITSDVKHVEFGLTDKSDSVRYILENIANPRSVSNDEILFVGDEFGEIHGFEGSDYKMIIPETRCSTYVSVGKEPGGAPDGVIHHARGPEGFAEIIDKLTMEHESAGIVPNWTIEETDYHPNKEPLSATHFVMGNGYLGLRGSFEELGVPGMHGLFVAGVFHMLIRRMDFTADTYFKKKQVFDEEKMAKVDHWRSIVVLPDMLFARVFINGRQFRMWEGRLLSYHRWLDMRNSCLHRYVRWDNGEGLDQPHSHRTILQHG